MTGSTERWMTAVLGLSLIAALSRGIPASAQTAESISGHGRDGISCPLAPTGSEATKYTYICHGDAHMPVASDTSRIAMLIGNFDYVGTDTANTRLQGLGPLGPPCEDVKMIARRLSALGWQKSELVVLCNQTGREMNDALTAFFTVAPETEAARKFMVLYYAGHGMKIGRKNYLVGTNARVDWEAKAASFVRSASNHQGFTLFEDGEAVDLYARLGRFMTRTVFPLIVIVDSCRDNPLVGAAKTAFDNALKTKDRETALALKGQAAVNLAGPATDLAGGIEIWYATASGRSIDDDYNSTGHSHLAMVLDEKLQAGGDVHRTRQEVGRKISDDEGWLAGQSQLLDKDGDVFEPANGPPCFGVCHAATAEVDSPLGSSSRFAVWRGQNSGALLRKVQFPGPSQTALPTSATKVRSKTYPVPANVHAVNLDVFWCSGDADGDARRGEAQAFFDKLDDRLTEHVPTSAAVIGNLRLREFTAAQNAKPGYQRSANAIYAPSRQVSEAVADLAHDQVRSVQRGLGMVVSRSSSGNYMSVFFCRAAFKGDKAARVYLQVATSDYLPAASGAMSLLDKQFSDIDVIRKTEIMAEHKGYPLEKYPSKTVIKYSSIDEQSVATTLACRLGALTGISVKTAQITNARVAHQIEVWVGGDESLDNWRNLGDRIALQPDLASRCPMSASPKATAVGSAHLPLVLPSTPI